MSYGGVIQTAKECISSICDNLSKFIGNLVSCGLVNFAHVPSLWDAAWQKQAT